MDKETSVRLNKAISDTGFCSRREADRYIEQGKVFVNNKPAVLGMRVSGEDDITVDGHLLMRKDYFVYLAFNKPRGITCTTDTHIKGNIIDFINYPERIFPVGRLDKDSEGLIFLTSEGNIVNKILRAGNNHEKEYLVTVKENISDDFIRKMADGIPILGTVTKKCFVKRESPDTFRIILTQGLNRQIRRMCDYLGYEVLRLRRLRIMNVNLGNLKTGEWRNLTEEELNQIREMVKDSVKTEDA